MITASPKNSPQTQCTPDACPACMLPKECGVDCETNLNAILEAADHYNAAIALLNEIFGKYSHCGPREYTDTKTFPPKNYVAIQVIRMDLLGLVPGEIEYTPRRDYPDAPFEASKKLIGDVRLIYLVKRHEAEELGLKISETENEKGDVSQ